MKLNGAMMIISPFSHCDSIQICFSNLILVDGLHLQDLTIKPKYLVTFTVGYNQKNNIDAAVKKVSPLFHYTHDTYKFASLFPGMSVVPYLKPLFYSSQRTSQLFCFIMMV